jgi:hypothetical protein
MNRETTITVLTRAIEIMRDPEVTQCFRKLSNGPKCFCAEGCIIEAGLELNILHPSDLIGKHWVTANMQTALFGEYDFLDRCNLLHKGKSAPVLTCNDSRKLSLPTIANLLEVQILNPIIAGILR